MHELGALDSDNQKFLTDYYAEKNGKKANIIASYAIYPKRDLTISENGSLQVLTWKNLSYKIPGKVYAVCYNAADGAYVIEGEIDEKGTATLSGLKLRAATNITIYVEE